MRTLLPGVLALMTVISCDTRPRQADIAEIAAHHALRHDGPCASWLSSFKTGFKYCASPVITIPPYRDPMAGVPEPDGEVTMAGLMERGERVYGKICAACHQENGQGVAGQYPPLAGAGEFYGDAQNHARIVVKGLSGPITVLGQNYNGAMPAQAQLTDYEIAAVTTYVRHSWGNNDGMVTPADVKAVR